MRKKDLQQNKFLKFYRILYECSFLKKQNWKLNYQFSYSMPFLFDNLLIDSSNKLIEPLTFGDLRQVYHNLKRLFIMYNL